MEQGRMMDAGVNPVVVDYDANSLSLYLSLWRDVFASSDFEVGILRGES